MKELNIPKGSFVTLFAGGSNSNAKGLSDFILAMNEVCKKFKFGMPNAFI